MKAMGKVPCVTQLSQWRECKQTPASRIVAATGGIASAWLHRSLTGILLIVAASWTS